LRRAVWFDRLFKLLALALLVSGAALFVVPFYTALNLSLKSEAEIKTTSTWALPEQPTVQNYQELLSSPNVSFLGFFWNTAIISVLATLGVLLSSSLVAYAFARLRFRGRDKLFLVMLSTMMLPAIITIIPSYLLFARLHWVNTFLPLIVPAWFGGGAFNIFLLRQFFLSIPRELDEAALLDGASHFTIWRWASSPSSTTGATFWDR
jgi:multiple sugar transport system permease protein